MYCFIGCNAHAVRKSALACRRSNKGVWDWRCVVVGVSLTTQLPPEHLWGAWPVRKLRGISTEAEAESLSLEKSLLNW